MAVFHYKGSESHVILILLVQDGYISPEEYGKHSLIPEDFSDVGEARTFVDSFYDEVAFTIATDYLRYNGTYWEESEHAVTLAMIEHTDVQLAEAEKQVEVALVKLESLGIARDSAVTGGKKFRDNLDDEQTDVYNYFLSELAGTMPYGFEFIIGKRRFAFRSLFKKFLICSIRYTKTLYKFSCNA